MLIQCCMCKKYKTVKGEYLQFMPVNPNNRISHGWCWDCAIENFPKHRKELEAIRLSCETDVSQFE